MARKFEEARKEILADPSRRERIEKEKEAMRTAVQLAALRRSREATQVELAATMGTTQANVSRIERTDNPYLATLDEYVRGLGGHLEVNAVFEDETIRLASREKKLS